MIIVSGLSTQFMIPVYCGAFSLLCFFLSYLSISHFLVYLACINFLQTITIKAASIVEPLGFSGSLPIMFFVLHILCNTIQANTDLLFCSFL